MQQAYAARFRRKFGAEDELSRYVSALYEMLASVIGQDKVVLRAGKVSALKMMRSQNLPDRLCGLQRLVFEDPTLERATTRAQQRKAIAEIEEAMADVIAQRHAEDSIERRVNEKMAERHQEYVKDLKLEALRETGGPETPASQAKLDELEALSQRGLAASALPQLRPQTLREVVGQESAIRALLAKISSPYPQHAILYGPPGVGKTTVARLALEVAKSRPYTPFAKDAPFVEASGTTLRWDPRETVNPLLGSVHDPIYQGSRREFCRGRRPRAQARVGHAGSRRRAFHRRNRRDGRTASIAAAQSAGGQTRDVRVVVLRRKRAERSASRSSASFEKGRRPISF